MNSPAYQAPDLSLRGAEHVEQYRRTDGRVGHDWNGVPVLLLTSTGRRSGRPHTTALIYGKDGTDYLVVASKGGAPAHPAWYHNLCATPEVELQVKAERFAARAHVAAGAERARLWSIATGYWPNYDAYQARTDREIPVVVLRPH